MNKWLARLLGVVILLLLAVVLGDKWFNPAVPPALQIETEQEAASQSVQTQLPAASPVPPPEPEQPQISLTSLQDMESDNGAPPPVLTNPQGKPEVQPKVSVPEAEPAADAAAKHKSTKAAEAKLVKKEPAAKTADKAVKTQSTPKAAKSMQPEAKIAKAPEPKVKPIPPPAPKIKSKPTSPTPAAKANAWVQAGAFGNRGNAERLAAQLRKNGLHVEIAAAAVNGGRLNRVYVGPLADSQVNSVLQKLFRMGVNARQVSR